MELNRKYKKSWEFQQVFPMSFNDFMGAMLPGSLLKSRPVKFKIPSIMKKVHASMPGLHAASLAVSFVFLFLTLGNKYQGFSKEYVVFFLI